MKRLLLHACCAPCSPYVIGKLKEKYLVTVFFYNPNIHGRREYGLRLKEMRRLCTDCRVPLIEGRYDPSSFFSLVGPLAGSGEGSVRCSACFRLRLEETMRTARMLGAEAAASTLTVSPHKKASRVNPEGLGAAGRFGLTFLDEDFKKNNGYHMTCQLSRPYRFYRQDYCGCIFSKQERDRRKTTHKTIAG
ncbi:MAG: epoxyqueuosine reductase QueH [Gemmatimonadota bacterium]|nr:epoxyqueuosine reductase QueH [Gemmatimonadota bacterium]